MSHKKKQERLQAGSRKKRNFQVERLEQRVVLASIAEFGLTTGSAPTTITSGPNGNLWFTESATNKIGEITPTGTITEFALTTGSSPQGITTGPNGNLWFTEYGGNKIGEITTGGTITEFALTSGSNPQQITTGSNGNLWFTEQGTNKIGEIVPSGTFAGTITEFALASGSSPFGITSGPNGNLWFTENGANKVGQIVPSGTFAGTINTYSLSNGAGPLGITTGSDGNLWFAENGGSNIGQVTLAGSVTEYSIPGSNGSPKNIVSGPLGDLYFTEGTGNNIIQMTTQGQFTDIAVPTANASPFGITQGPDNHIWFTEYGTNQIGRLNLNPTADNDTYYAPYGTSANPLVLTVNAANGVLANDSDPENDSISVISGDTGIHYTSHGIMNMGSNGSFTYEPYIGFSGVDTYTYQVTDGQDNSNTATVTLITDLPPTANNDTYSTPVSTTLTENAANGVLANDTDPNSHTMTANVVTQPSHGTLTLNANGSFTYIPNNGYHGTDSFTYYALDSDDINASNTATVSLLVDSPPVATNDTYTADINTALNITSPASGVLANDTAFNGDTLTVAAQDVGMFSTAHGTITMASNGTFSYTANNYTGIDTFSYYAYDGYQNSLTPATITFTVNNTPDAVDHNYEVLESDVLNISAPGVLAGATGTGSLSAVLDGGPFHGTVTLNANGSFIYTPTSGFSGLDYFYYEATDGLADSIPRYAYIDVDAPPTIIPQTYDVTPNTPLSENAANGVLNGNTDTFNTQLYAYIGTNPSHGSLSWGPNDGSFTYTPYTGYHGVDSFTYYTYDGFGYSQGDGTVTLNVDSPPSVVNQSYDDVQNTSLNMLAGQGLLVGATQANDESLTAVDLTQPSHGTVTVNANGSFSYVPTAGYYGPDSFTYTANDGIRNGNTGTVSIYVDQPPVGVADNYNVVENTSLTKNAASGVLANDTDTDEEPLTAALVETTAHGTLNLFQDGSFTYTPNTGYYGNDTFTYQANDGITDSAITTVTIHVDAPPVGVNDSYNVIENQTFTQNAAGGVLANDTQAQNESLTASLISNPSHGTLTLYQDGSFGYVPTTGYYGTDSFTYKPYDGIANGNITTVSIFVDSPPVANNDSYNNVFESTAYSVNAANGVLANDTQAQSESLTAVNPSTPTHGTVTLNTDGSFTYTPTTGYYGSDSFTYDAYDGHTDSLTPATVNLLVDATPVAVADSYRVPENGTLAPSAPGVLANDTQAQDSTLTAHLVSGPSDAASFTLNADGSFSYVPTTGYYGTDSFTYDDTDTAGQGSNTTTVTINVDATPDAVNDSYNTTENTTLTVNAANGVLANDTQAQNLTLESFVINNPADGSLTLNADGSFTYIPTTGFYGNVTFTYKDYPDVDSSDLSNLATVTIHVDAPPDAVDDSYNGKEGLPLTVNAASGVLSNDVQAQSETLTPSIVTAPANGTVTLNSDGSFSYTPNAQFFGTDTFTYADNDGYTTGNTATVTINVAEDFAPTANNVSQLVGEGGITVNAPGILTGDTDSNGQPLTAILVSEPSHGSLTFNANGSYVYIPNSSFGSAGTDSFTFRTFDNVLTSSIATVTLTFDGNYYAPTADSQTYSLQEGSTLTESAPGLLTGAADYWNLPLNAVIATEPSHGTLTPDGNGDGGFTYTPTAGYFGTDSFTYEASNNHTDSAAQTVTLNVSESFGAPVAANDSYTTNEATTLTENAANGVLANDSDPNSLPLNAILVSNPTHGSVQLNGNGSFTYTPTAGYYGTDSFTYKDSDGQAFSNNATVTLTVDQVYYAPTAINQTYTVANGETLTESAPGVLTGDTDPNSLSLNAQLFGMPTHDSSFTLNNNGSFTYVPTPGYVGTDTFTYKAADGQAISSLATVTITVTNPLTVTGTTISPIAGTAFSGNVGSFTDANPTAPIGNFSAVIYWGDSTTSTGTITQPGGVGTAFEVSGTHTYGTTGDLTASVVITDNNENSASANTTVNVATGAPVAVNDPYYSLNENGYLNADSSFGVLANDTDPQGDPLTAILVTSPAHGSLAFNADGSFIYTPTANYYGVDSFTYKDNNGVLNGNIATVTLTIDQVYYPPTAINQTYSLANGQTLTISAPGVLTGDTDPNDLSLNSQLFGLPSHDSSFTFNPDGSFTYVPTPGYVGTDTFTYKAADGEAISSLATVTITITNPLAVTGTTASANEGTTFTGNVGSFTDANPTAPIGNFNAVIHWGDSTTSAGTITQPGGVGTAFEVSGTHTYGISGSLTASIVITDNNSNSASANSTLTVAPTSPLAPVAVNDSYTLNENATLTTTSVTGVLANDTDPQSDPLSSILVTNPAHGTVAFNADGSFTYTPNAYYYGSDSFTYKDNDGSLTGNTATVNLTISQVQYAPVAVADSYTATENTNLSVPAGTSPLVNDSQSQGDPFYFYPINIHTSQGGLILQDTPGTGAFIYQPPTGFVGTDTFQYKDIDSNNDLSSNIVTVTITITGPTPVAPVANNDSQIVGEGGIATATYPGGGDVLANDVDNSVNPLTALLVSEPSHGTLTFNSNGTYTYAPNSSFGAAGTDSFTYRAFDGTLLSNVATVTLTFEGPYYAPDAQSQTYSLGEGSTLTESAPGVLAGAEDYWGLPLTAINLEDGPSHGSLTLNSDGSFTYTPTAGYYGTDTFEYEANNGQTSSTAQTVTITVTAVYTPPVAVNQTYSTPQGTALTTTSQNSLLVGDSDSNSQPLTALLVSSPSNGTLNFNSNGIFTYTPNAGYSGADSFTYEVNDGTSTSNVATVSFNITPPNTPPAVAVNDSYTTTEGTTLTTTGQNGVLANDTNSSENSLNPVLVSNPTNGTLTFNPDGSFTYVPNPNFYGTDRFTYEDIAGEYTSDVATVMLTVTQVYQPPVVVDGSFSTSEGTTLGVNGIGVLAGATDPNNLPLTASVVSEPSHGTLTLNANGSFVYVPNSTYIGTDSFTFKANDGELDSNVGTVTLTIAQVEQAPIANPDLYYVGNGQTISITNMGGILADDIDKGPAPLTAILVTEPSHGTLNLDSNGSFTYTPVTGYSGPDSFTYKNFDGQMDSNVTTVSLTINPPKPTPKSTPVAGDYFGTGQADPAVYLVNQGEYAIQNPQTGADVMVPFGISGAGQTIPAPGDYFGTGLTDIAAYLPSQGAFAIRNPAGGPDEIVPFGIAGTGQTIPAPGDYFGTGQTDIAAYLPSIGAFAIRNPAGGPDEIVPFGIAGAGNSIPAPGDYDGSGKTELAVYMPSLGEFAYRPANGGPDVITQFGMAGQGNSIPMPGDYDGSGKTEYAVYIPSLGEFAYRPANGGPDVVESFGVAGNGQTLPAPGDYTGVGYDELAAFLPNTATFAIRPGGGQPDISGTFGAAGLGQTIPVTVVDQALAEMPSSTVTAQSIEIPDPSTITDSVIFPTTPTAPKKNHRSQ